MNLEKIIFKEEYKLSEIKIKVLGNYAPNLRSIKNYPCSGYYIKGLKKIVVLDLGMGVLPRLLKELSTNKEISTALREIKQALKVL